MTPRIIEASHVGGYTLRIRFSDGSGGDVDLEPELEGEIFLPLKDPGFFKRFVLHPELHALAWPNGADFAPEFLYEKIVSLKH